MKHLYMLLVWFVFIWNTQYGTSCTESPPWVKLPLPEKDLEVILKFIAVVEKLQSPLLLQLILITIPKMELNVIYELIHVRQRQDLLKTHLGRDGGNRRVTLFYMQSMHWTCIVVADLKCASQQCFISISLACSWENLPQISARTHCRACI